MVSILFLAAEPTDGARLRLGEEVREIREKLQLAKARDSFVLHERFSVRPADISQVLLDLNPQIVHFSGHGTAKGEICVEDSSGYMHAVQPEILAGLFEQFANQVKCVVLNACYSERQAQAIGKHIGYVIGMNKAIGDRAAIAFSVGLYQALGAKRSVEESYKLGCVQIGLQGIPELLTPILIKNIAYPDNDQSDHSIKVVETRRETVTVDVVITRTGQRLTIQVALDSLARYVVDQLVEYLSLPQKLENSWPIIYHLYSKTTARMLNDSLTLRQNDIYDGDTLSLHIESQAG